LARVRVGPCVDCHGDLYDLGTLRQWQAVERWIVSKASCSWTTDLGRPKTSLSSTSQGRIQQCAWSRNHFKEGNSLKSYANLCRPIFAGIVGNGWNNTTIARVTIDILILMEVVGGIYPMGPLYPPLVFLHVPPCLSVYRSVKVYFTT
jgi:hypothetical protein